MAFSVPADFETAIQKHARSEHRTVSEYLREAVRHYMLLRDFELTQRTVAKRVKKRGIKRKDVAAVIADLRK